MEEGKGVEAGPDLPSLSASGTKSIENVSVRTMLLTSAPEVRYSGNLQLPAVSNRYTNNWLAIIVEYTPKFKTQSGKKVKRPDFRIG